MGEGRKLGARRNRGRERTSGEERKERAGGGSSQKGRKVGEITQQHSIVFRSQKGKREEANKKFASAGKANMESKIFRSFLYGYTRNILYCHLLYPFQIFSSVPFVAVDLYRSKPLISLVRFNLHFHCFQG